jgi:plasmid stabilization system protein ParE
MTYRIFVTSRAKLQLIQSALWWADHRSPDQADRWLDGFETAIDALADNPERHGLAAENRYYDLPNPVRQLLYGLGKRPTHRGSLKFATISFT